MKSSVAVAECWGEVGPYEDAACWWEFAIFALSGLVGAQDVGVMHAPDGGTRQRIESVVIPATRKCSVQRGGDDGVDEDYAGWKQADGVEPSDGGAGWYGAGV